ncbi:VOC family protein [Enterovirga sp. CN4-39]|uniref:VOC family protein n=1 Tax=Enterovirga sp. CN4-39 TaxID=3400910 RepID=UPI003BFB1A80
MPGITPCLWFDGVAEEAAAFYANLIPDSRVERVDRSPIDTPSGQAGSVLTVEFVLYGQRFLGLNGGPHFKFSEAVSFILECEGQDEVDRYWAALCEGGQPGPCGWLKDRYGLSWQIVPREALAMWRDPDQARAARAMGAIMEMGKLDVAAIRRAYEGAA